MEIKEVLKGLEFYDKLDEAQQQMLVDSSKFIEFKKRQNVHDSQDKCLGIIFIVKGQLRTYMLSEDGREITLYRLFDNDICVMSASCVLDAITFDVRIDAEEDTKAIVISSQVFNKLKELNKDVELFAYKMATTRFSDVMWAMQQILFMGVDKRLAIFLSDEISKTGKMSIEYSHEQIAKYIGSAREVVSRMLKYFASEGIVEMSRREIKIIDRNKLRGLTR